MRFVPIALAAALALTGMSAPEAHARSDPWRQHHAPEGSLYLAKRQGDIGPDAAAARVRKATGGRVLGVRRGKGGTPIYRVKVLLPGGRVRTISVHGQTGKILN